MGRRKKRKLSRKLSLTSGRVFRETELGTLFVFTNKVYTAQFVPAEIYHLAGLRLVGNTHWRTDVGHELRLVCTEDETDICDVVVTKTDRGFIDVLVKRVTAD